MPVSFKHIKLRTLKLLLYTFVVHSFSITQIVCQNIAPELNTDSLVVDSTIKTSSIHAFDTVDINIKDDDIKSPVHYKALDSIVYDVENKKLYLYGNSEMKYDNTQVNSERIVFDWTTQILTAEGIDSAEKKTGTPVLVQDGKTYESNKMEYNFKTTKGKIYDVVTEENGAFIHSEIVKKQADNSWLSYKSKYTTCNDKKHPHFYIQSKKAKIIPDKVMISGPANLVISNINTPIALPFAIFPIKQGRRSGLILPQYGFENGEGAFFLRDGGYYWAANDFLSMGFTGEIWTNGTFGLKVASNYRVRYKSSGNLLLSYRRKSPSDPIKNKGDIKNDYKLNWSHRMDSKADPNNNFIANVNIITSSYNRNNLIQDQRVLEVVNSSHVTYTRRFNGKPYNLKITANHSSNNNTHVFSMTLPEMIFTVNTINPFKPKISTTKKKFYENIGFNYNIRGRATATAIDTTFFTEKTLEKIKYGIDQDLRISANYKAFKYLDINPQINYKEQWMFKKETIEFDEHYIQVNDSTIDTLFTRSSFDNGFFARRNFNLGVSFQTELKGIYNFKKGKVKGIMHRITPNISYNYHPDFSKPMWNYFSSYSDSELNKVVDYNQFSNTNVYGTANPGEQNGFNFSLNNILEMKVLNKKDTSKTYKKIPILKSLNISSGYNFAGDSIRKFQNVKIFASTSFLNNLFSLRGTLIYNPYSVDKKNNRISKLYAQTHGKPLRFVRMDLNLAFTLRGKPKKKKELSKNEYGSVEQLDYIARNPEQYYDFDIPWSFFANYHMSLSNGVTGVTRDSTVLGLGSITFGGDITITPKWKILVNSGFDIKRKDLTITNLTLTRDLHCWEMSLVWTAYPIERQNYEFRLNVKSALLQDLKLTRRHLRQNYNSSF